MLQEISKLIVGIIHFSVGIILILFWKKITKALLKSTYTFWGELGGIGKKTGILGGEKFAYFMILLIGILFLLSGSYIIYQFFSPYLVSYIKKDVRMSQLFLDNHLGKLREKNYNAAYDDFSEEAKKAFPLQKYLQLQKLIENKLGDLNSFEMINYQKKIGIGRRPTSIMLTYKMEYSKEKAFSTFITVKEKKELKIYHYNINSPALATEELGEIFR